MGKRFCIKAGQTGFRQNSSNWSVQKVNREEIPKFIFKNNKKKLK